MKMPQLDNPLHGITLEMILNQLVACYGWDELGRKIEIRCFIHEPSIGSSLKFLRRTPWARQQVESLYIAMLRHSDREKGRNST
ncbi:MAG: VF530 family protein [Sulfuritalea sp.]|nr:VF530 family protein [Sulfuritalea sp.]